MRWRANSGMAELALVVSDAERRHSRLPNLRPLPAGGCGSKITLHLLVPQVSDGPCDLWWGLALEQSAGGVEAANQPVLTCALDHAGVGPGGDEPRKDATYLAPPPPAHSFCHCTPNSCRRVEGEVQLLPKVGLHSFGQKSTGIFQR